MFLLALQVHVLQKACAGPTAGSATPVWLHGAARWPVHSPAAPSPALGGPQTVLEVSSPRGWEGAPKQPAQSQSAAVDPDPRRVKTRPHPVRLCLENTARPLDTGSPQGPVPEAWPQASCPSTGGDPVTPRRRSLWGLRLTHRVGGLTRDAPATALDAGAAPLARSRGGGHSPSIYNRTRG